MVRRSDRGVMAAVNKNWAPIIERARQIVLGYDTPVTLRQLFYRLVSEQMITNTTSSYQSLSRITARAREAGAFPHFVDQGRKIEREVTFEGAADAVDRLARDYYRRDRTEGQPYSLFLGVEKRGIVEQLRSWFGHLGLPIVAMGGFGSVTLLHDLELELRGSDRPAILVYAGDFDPSGESIIANAAQRCAGFDLTILQIALNQEQVAVHNLPINEGKPKDPRAAGFRRKYGRLMQVELDALPPDVLRQLYASAIAEYWDDDVYTYTMIQEGEERERLIKLASSMGSETA
jgi:hypothetical protein